MPQSRFIGRFVLLPVAVLLNLQAFGAYDEELQLATKQIAPLATSFVASVPAAGGKLESHGIASYSESTQDFLRLESAWTRDLGDTARILRIGDSVSSPGAWGSAVRFAGVQYGTRFDLRSDLLQADRLPLSGVAILPSVLDAVLLGNGASANTAQRGLALMRAPAITATNGLSIAARDAVGRTTTLTAPLLAKQESVAAGCQKFSVALGRARQDYALVSDSYGPLFANSTMLCGTDSGWGFEAHGEYLQGQATIAGLNVLRPIKGVGNASVAFVASDNDKGAGWLVRAGLQHSNELFEINLRARVQSQDFRELGDTLTLDAVEQRVLASIGAKTSNNSTLAFAYANQTTFSQQRTDIMAMTQTFNLQRRGTVAIGANRAINDDAKSSVNLSYSRAIY
jgi:outer membrane usher protein